MILWWISAVVTIGVGSVAVVFLLWWLTCAVRVRWRAWRVRRAITELNALQTQRDAEDWRAVSGDDLAVFAEDRPRRSRSRR